MRLLCTYTLFGAAIVLALNACAPDPCGRGKAVAETCGAEWNGGDCDDKVGDCSEEDKELVVAYYDCLEKDGECADGEMGNDGAVISCVDEANGISEACLKIITSD